MAVNVLQSERAALDAFPDAVPLPAYLDRLKIQVSGLGYDSIVFADGTCPDFGNWPVRLLLQGLGATVQMTSMAGMHPFGTSALEAATRLAGPVKGALVYFSASEIGLASLPDDSFSLGRYEAVPGEGASPACSALWRYADDLTRSENPSYDIQKDTSMYFLEHLMFKHDNQESSYWLKIVDAVQKGSIEKAMMVAAEAASAVGRQEAKALMDITRSGGVDRYIAGGIIINTSKDYAPGMGAPELLELAVRQPDYIAPRGGLMMHRINELVPV